MGALLTASSLLNLYANFLSGLDKKLLSYEAKTICQYIKLLKLTQHARAFQPINWSNVNIFE